MTLQPLQNTVHTPATLTDEHPGSVVVFMRKLGDRKGFFSVSK